MTETTGMPPAKARRRSWPIRVPADWRVVRRSGTPLYDLLVPGAFVLLALVTLGIVAFAIGVLVGLVPWS